MGALICSSGLRRKLAAKALIIAAALQMNGIVFVNRTLFVGSRPTNVQCGGAALLLLPEQFH